MSKEQIKNDSMCIISGVVIGMIGTLILLFGIIGNYYNKQYEIKEEILEEHYKKKQCTLLGGIYTKGLCVKEDNFIELGDLWHS